MARKRGGGGAGGGGVGGMSWKRSPHSNFTFPHNFVIWETSGRGGSVAAAVALDYNTPSIIVLSYTGQRTDERSGRKERGRQRNM